MAAIGVTRNGDRWFAPTNWVSTSIVSKEGDVDDIYMMEKLDIEKVDIAIVPEFTGVVI